MCWRSVPLPGVDGITCHHLKMLATLFSKVLLHSQVLPTCWTHTKIIMVHKNGDPTVPANFRPIALTSVIGKLFHKILAIRLETTWSPIWWSTSQYKNGSFEEWYGCIEHVFAIQSMLVNAMEHSLPLSEFYRSGERIWISIPCLHHWYTQIYQTPSRAHKLCEQLVLIHLGAHLYKELEDTTLSNQQGCISGGYDIPTSVFDCLQLPSIQSHHLWQFIQAEALPLRCRNSLRQTSTPYHAKTVTSMLCRKKKTLLRHLAGTLPRFCL